MEDIDNWKGINGQLVTFKSEVEKAQKITFIGSPGVCTPFAELLAYAIRDKESHFILILKEYPDLFKVGDEFHKGALGVG